MAKKIIVEDTATIDGFEFDVKVWLKPRDTGRRTRPERRKGLIRCKSKHKGEYPINAANRYRNTVELEKYDGWWVFGEWIDIEPEMTLKEQTQDLIETMEANLSDSGNPDTLDDLGLSD